MFGFAIRGRRKQLDRTLREDITQPAGWESWLENAKSIDQLHASCPQPGWLVYCAYWAKVPQDKLLDGALALGVLACERQEQGPITVATMKKLRDLDWPDLAQLMFDLLEPNPMARFLVGSVPTQDCTHLYHLGTLWMRKQYPEDFDDDDGDGNDGDGNDGDRDDSDDDDGDGRDARKGDDGDDLDDLDEPDDDVVAEALADVNDHYGLRRDDTPTDASLLGPYRESGGMLAPDLAVPYIAAGYVLTMETLMHRAQGLREALATRSAAGASLLRMTSPSFEREALAMLRKTYGWS